MLFTYTIWTFSKNVGIKFSQDNKKAVEIIPPWCIFFILNDGNYSQGVYFCGSHLIIIVPFRNSDISPKSTKHIHKSIFKKHYFVNLDISSVYSPVAARASPSRRKKRERERATTKETHTERERDAERERDTARQRDRETVRETKRQDEWGTHTRLLKHKHTHTQSVCCCVYFV